MSELEPRQDGPEAWDVYRLRDDGCLELPPVRPHRSFGTEAEARAWIFGFEAREAEVESLRSRLAGFLEDPFA